MSAKPGPDGLSCIGQHLIGSAFRITEVDAAESLVGLYDRARPMGSGRPWVMANMVCGLDGCAAVGGRVGSLSGPADMELFHHLRTLADAVLVGAETVRREGYGPVSRAASTATGRGDSARVAVVSRSLRFDWSLPLFTAPDDGPMFLTCSTASPSALAEAARYGDVLVVGDDRVDLVEALSVMASRGIEVVLAEGGPTLLGELAALDLLDEFCLTISPTLGGDPLPVVVAPPGAPLRTFRLCHNVNTRGSVFLRYEREALDG